MSVPPGVIDASRIREAWPRACENEGVGPLPRYDLIGDIHGFGEPLVALLKLLGYRKRSGVYRHAERTAIFLGDFIDRGPNQREVIEIVRGMIEQNFAFGVMGNHEFSAIAYATRDPGSPDRYLREHSSKHRGQHQAFLETYEGCDDYAELIEWFRTLPLWLELPGLRVTHACWDSASMRDLENRYPTVNKYLDDALLVRATRSGSSEFVAVETVLKGREVKLPEGRLFVDRDGISRDHIRVRWFDNSARTYRDAFLGPRSARDRVPDGPIDAAWLTDYSQESPPVVIGHYWLDSVPELLAPNIACLDYSVAAPGGGKLVAYRWDGEQRLDAEKFVWVERQSA